MSYNCRAGWAMSYNCRDGLCSITVGMGYVV